MNPKPHVISLWKRLHSGDIGPEAIFELGAKDLIAYSHSGYKFHFWGAFHSTFKDPT